MDRRNFLKRAFLGSALVSNALVANSKPAKATSLLGLRPTPTPDGSKMTLRDPAKTGTPVSILGYGGMRWPTQKNERNRDVIDQDKVNQLIDYAMEHGVNYYDTAPVYHGGQSEKAMGIALNRHPRDKWMIATKLSNFDSRNWTLENAKAMYHKSFSELGVDYIDYYLLHSLGSGADSFTKRWVDNGIIAFLEEERKAGRIRRLGFSFHGDRESWQTAMAYPVKWDFVQIQMNYFDWLEDCDKRPSAKYLYEDLAARNIPVVIMEPLLGGRLARLSDHLLAQLKERDPNETAASWAFRFVGSYPMVLTALSGMTYMEHLQENVRTFSPLKPVTEADKRFLQETATAMMKYPTIPCTACRYCVPCPNGVDIPGNFAYFNKCLIEGNVPVSSQAKGYAKARKAFLGKYSKNVTPKAQASACTDCKICVEKCPQHIDIPKQLSRVNRLVMQLKNNTL